MNIKYDLDKIYAFVLNEFSNYRYILAKFNINYSYKSFFLEEYDFYLSERNPILKVEIWKDINNNELILSENVKIFRSLDLTKVYFDLKCSDRLIYGVFRSEFTNYIRKCLNTKYPLSLHASCVNLNNKNYAIIGKKGSGKSSSALYLKNKGGQIFTDEFIFFNRKFEANCLNRYLAINYNTHDKYFENYKLFNKISIENLFNTDTKVLIDIVDKQIKPLYIDKFVLLLKGDNKNLSLREKLKIINTQSIINNSNLSKNFLIFISKNCLVMNLKDIMEMK